MKLWTVYDTTTKDFPGQYVAREFDIDSIPAATDNHFTSEDLETVREWVFKEASKVGVGEPFKLVKARTDDPVILETWM